MLLLAGTYKKLKIQEKMLNEKTTKKILRVATNRILQTCLTNEHYKKSFFVFVMFQLVVYFKLNNSSFSFIPLCK